MKTWTKGHPELVYALDLHAELQVEDEVPGKGLDADPAGPDSGYLVRIGEAAEIIGPTTGDVEVNRAILGQPVKQSEGSSSAQIRILCGPEDGVSFKSEPRIQPDSGTKAAGGRDELSAETVSRVLSDFVCYFQGLVLSAGAKRKGK